jgi:hypothetical protein
VLKRIFRYKLLSNPEGILLGNRGNQLTLVGWLVTTLVIGLISRSS